MSSRNPAGTQSHIVRSQLAKSFRLRIQQGLQYADSRGPVLGMLSIVDTTSRRKPTFGVYNHCRNANSTAVMKPWATLAALLAASWITMTTTHELGHLVGGWIGGAELQDFNIVPWRLPYSLHAPDPRPQLTLWSGPLVGALVPFAIGMAIGHPFARFIGDFCLLANGVYLLLGWFSGAGHLDTPRMLAAGV